MNQSSTAPLRPPIWRGRTPGPAEFEALLNVISVPGCVIDLPRKLMLIVNQPFLHLTGYTQLEVAGFPVVEFLDGFDQEDLALNLSLPMKVNSRTGDGRVMSCRAVALDAAGQWILVTFSERSEEEILKSQEEYVKKLLNLAQAASADHLVDFQTEALAIMGAILKVDGVSLYQAQSDYPNLQKMACFGDSSLFPQIIPSTDLIRLADTTLWRPGRRIQTQLHRHARVSDISVVASTPIGEKGALSGLIAVAVRSAGEKEISLELLEFVGVLFGSALQNYFLSYNLNNRIQQLEKKLTIRENLFETTREGVLLLNLGLNIFQINPAAEIMLGYTDAEVHGQPVDNVLIGSDGIAPMLDAAIRGIATHNLGPIYLHRRTGQAFPAVIRTFPINEADQSGMIVVYINDVSEDEQNRIKVQQLEQRAFLGDFTAIFAHEVRNPINNLTTALQLLATLMEPQDPNQDVINRMQGDCLRLNTLMESVLSFSRPMDIKVEKIDIVVLLRKILDRWRPRCSRVNVTSQLFQAEDAIAPIHGDPRALEQVFTNLISNAVEAMSKTGGMLTLRVGYGPSIGDLKQVEITVSDEGPGIPDEVRERIFEPFVTTNPRQGNGLGLAITKMIITAHKGSIGVNSFPGGTVFHVCLPVDHGEVMK